MPTQQGGPYVDNKTPAEMINFGLGQPSPRLLPLDLIADGAARLAQADRLVLQYGKTQGTQPFRQALADFLTQQHGVQIEAEHLASSGAISLSLSLLSDTLGRRRGLIACEDPTYFLARGVFESSGLRTMGIPVDDEGMRVEVLAKRIAQGELPDFVYVIPAFQNPTGVCLSAERREALFELARAHDFVVVADEPYNLLNFEGHSPPPLASYAGVGDHVVSVSSFTKILAPGLRTGWWHASPALLRRLLAHGTLRSGGNLNPVVNQMLLPLVEGGELADNVASLRHTLSERATALYEAVSEHLPGVRLRRPTGGYFCWLDFGDGVDTEALRKRAKAHAVSFYPGGRSAIEADLGRYARLSFAFYEPDELREGVRRIAAALG